VSLPKFVVQRAADLSVAGAELVVVADDPVVRFPLVVDGSVSFRLSGPRAFTPDDLDALLVNVSAAVPSAPVSLGVNSAFDGERTTFHLRLVPDQSLRGVGVPVEIPKCLAAHVRDLELSGEYRVVRDDPLIVWNFDRLDQPADITFSVEGDIDEECKQQLRALALAQGVGKPLSPWRRRPNRAVRRSSPLSAGVRRSCGSMVS